MMTDVSRIITLDVSGTRLNNLTADGSLSILGAEGTTEAQLKNIENIKDRRISLPKYFTPQLSVEEPLWIKWESFAHCPN